MIWGCWVRGPHLISSYSMCTSFSLGWGKRHHQLLPCIARRNCVNHLGTWNVREIKKTVKGEKLVDVYRKGKFKTKLKGNGEVSWYHCQCSENGKS